MIKISLFASGNGTNVQQITEYFRDNKNITVDCVVVNKADAFVIERAKTLKLPCFYFNRADFYESSKILDLLKARNVDYIILAGFLWLIPNNLLQYFNNRIINIHPALLPKYGGKGMYGHHVHCAVIDNKETQSGITIHYVNSKYDEGQIIFQTTCSIEPDDTPESLSNKIHLLEKEYYPQIIEKTLIKH